MATFSFTNGKGFCIDWSTNQRVRVKSVSFRIGNCHSGINTGAGNSVAGIRGARLGLWNRKQNQGDSAISPTWYQESDNSGPTGSGGTYWTSGDFYTKTAYLDAVVEPGTYSIGVWSPVSGSSICIGWGGPESTLYDALGNAWESFAGTSLGPTRPIWYSVVTAPADDRPTINFASPPEKTLVKHDALFRVEYTGNTSITSNNTTVFYSVNGESYVNLGVNNNGGTIDVLPSSKGILPGSAFKYKLKRYNSLSTPQDSLEMTREFRTFTLPTINSFSVNYNKINANTLAKFIWSNWTGAFEFDPVYSWHENSLLYLSINGSPDILCGEDSYVTSVLSQEIVLGHLDGTSGYVDFVKDNISVNVILKRVHKDTGVTATKTIPVTVRYTPTETIQNFSPDLKNQSNIVSTDQTSLDMSWSYPDNINDVNNGQNGVVSLYELNFISTRDGSVVKEITTSKSFSLNLSKLKPTVAYNLLIYPVYTNNLTGESLIYSRGPVYAINNYVTRISRIKTPVIAYPVSGGDWYGLTFRIALRLPEDPDYQHMTAGAASTYLYEDIEVMINGVVKSIKLNPTAFSSLLTELTYQSKIVFNPVLAGFNLNSPIFSVRVRVKKKYVTQSLELAWTSWSQEVFVNNRTKPLILTSQGSTVSLSEVNAMDNEVTKITGSYFPVENYVPSHDVIKAVDFLILFTQMLAVTTTINGYAIFNAGRVPVRFNSLGTFIPDNVEITYNTPNGYIQKLLASLDVLCS